MARSSATVPPSLKPYPILSSSLSQTLVPLLIAVFVTLLSSQSPSASQIGLKSKDQDLLVTSMIVLMRPLWELLVLMLANLLLRANSTRMPGLYPNPVPLDTSYCLSWRVGVEANNIRYIHTIPFQCIAYIEKYMIGGQYNSDVNVVIEQMFAYLSEIVVSDDGNDAWVFDMDDTCLSNLFYYEGKNFGTR